MTNLDNVLKNEKQSRYPANKGPYSQGFGLPIDHVWLWELDCRTMAECQRIDAFKLWCWRRLLRVPRIAWRSNQSILREINSEYSLEGLILKLKLQYFGHLIRTADSLEKSLMLGKFEGKSRWVCQRMKWLNAITNATDMNLGKLQGMVRDREAWRTAAPGVAKSRTRLATEPQQLFNVVSVSSFLHVIL